jgi:hypothetical protein
MSLYPKRKQWTKKEMRRLIMRGRNVYVRVAVHQKTWLDRSHVTLQITKLEALELLGPNKPRPKFTAYGDGDVVLG